MLHNIAAYAENVEGMLNRDLTSAFSRNCIGSAKHVMRIQPASTCEYVQSTLQFLNLTIPCT